MNSQQKQLMRTTESSTTRRAAERRARVAGATHLRSLAAFAVLVILCPTLARGRPSVSASPVSLFVAISPGLPRRNADTGIREIAVHISGLNASLVSDGVLVLSRDKNFSFPLKTISVWDEIEDDEQPAEGRVLTGFTFAPTNFSVEGPPSGDCVGFFVRLEWHSSPVAESCLRIFPNWMADLVERRPSAGNLTLNSLAIPGAHNAGAFKVYRPPEESFVTWYRDCQEEDIYTQLLYGSRFLDIRPGLSKVNGTYTFWVYHSVIRTDNLLVDVLKDVRRFLDEHPREVVFLDFHEFPLGFSSSADYRALGDLVEKYLGSYALRDPVASTTLADAVASGRRAVITFEADVTLASTFLPGVDHLWANTDDLQALKNRLLTMQESRSTGNYLYSSMAQLTAQGALNILTDKYRGGVRGLSHRNNIKIASWWRTHERFRSTANIVAIDYIASCAIVEVCISINEQRASSQ